MTALWESIVSLFMEWMSTTPTCRAGQDYLYGINEHVPLDSIAEKYRSSDYIFDLNVDVSAFTNSTYYHGTYSPFLLPPP